MLSSAQAQFSHDDPQLRIRAMAVRDRQLWGIGVLVVVVLATGFLALVAPNLLWRTDVMRVEFRYLPQLAFGLLALTLLFNLYIFQQRRELNNAREALLNQLLGRSSPEAPLLDPLTQGFHRHCFEPLLAREADRVSRLGGSLALILLQVHGLRAIQKRFGEGACEHFMGEVGQLLERALHGGEIMVHYAPDQFLLLLRDTEAQQAAVALEQIALECEAWNSSATRPYKLDLISAHAGHQQGGDVRSAVRLLEQEVRRKSMHSDRAGSLTPVCLFLGCSPEVARGLRPPLESMGVAVEVAALPAGLELLARRKFDGVVLEVGDFEKTGALLREIRTLPAAKGVVLLVVSSPGVSADAIFRLGANLVLPQATNSDITARCLRAAYGLMVAERRRYFRHRVEIPVILRMAGRKVEATATNISEGGMAIRCTAPLPLDSEVLLRFTLPNLRPAIEITGEIGWVEAQGSAGVRFVSMAKDVRRSLQEWRLQRLEQENDPADFMEAFPPGRPASV